MGRGRNLALVGAITAIAAIVRFYAIRTTPPGFHFDEAFEAVQALGVVRGQGYPPFFEGNFGVEPAFIYLIALFFRVFNVTHLAGRLLAAAVGTLTVPALFFLVREVYKGQDADRSARRLGLVSAMTLAVLFWHVHFSRLGIEPILVPLNAAAVLFLLWRAIETGRPWAFAACGVAIAFGPYTYPAGRLLPVLALAVGCHALSARSRTYPFLRAWPALKIGLLLLAAALVLLPLGSYFAAHPQLLTQRIGQVSVAGAGQGSASPLQTMAANLWSTVGMFSFAGDLDQRNNVPGRPVLDPAWSVLFVLGVVVCLARFRRPEYGLPLWWLVVMSAPTVLSEHAPHFRRALGAAPAVALLIGIGALWAAEAAERLFASKEGRRGLPPLVTGGLVGVLWLYGGAVSLGDYFSTWARLPALYYAFDVGLMDIAQWMRGLPDDQALYLSPVRQDHQTVVFVMDAEERPRTFDGRRCLVVPPANQSGAFVNLAIEDPDSPVALARLIPGLKQDREFTDWTGERYATGWLIPYGERTLAPKHRSDARLGSATALVGWDTPDGAVQPGDSFSVRLYWQSLGLEDRDYTAFVHLSGPPNPMTGGPLWAQEDAQPCKGSYPTRRWAPGETIVEEYRLRVPTDAPPGQYSITAGMYLLETLQRLPVTVAGVTGQDSVTLGVLHVRLPAR